MVPKTPWGKWFKQKSDASVSHTQQIVPDSMSDPRGLTTLRSYLDIDEGLTSQLQEITQSRIVHDRTEAFNIYPPILNPRTNATKDWDFPWFRTVLKRDLWKVVVASTISSSGETFAYISAAHFEVWQAFTESHHDLMCWGHWDGRYWNKTTGKMKSGVNLTRRYAFGIVSDQHLILVPNVPPIASDWIDIHSTRRGERITSLDMRDGASALALNLKGTVLAVGTKEGNVKLFSTPQEISNKGDVLEAPICILLKTISISPVYHVRQLSFSPDFQYLAISNGISINTYCLSTEPEPSLISTYPNQNETSSFNNDSKATGLILYVANTRFY